MIQKISFLDSSVNCVDYQGYTHNVADSSVINKINELVDAVNSLRDDCNVLMGYIAPEDKCEPAENGKCAKIAQDPYTEQRKLIGKLCRFRDIHSDVWEYGTLETVKNVDHAIDSAFRSSDGYWYDICEPVKPDDEIIYKGEQ